MKETTAKNVYQLAQERLDIIFKEFDNVYVSFSGGKDSGVLLNMCIDYIRSHKLNRKLGVYFMDYEVQYKMTIDYVERIFEANKDILDVYRICVPFRVATSTSMYQSYWRPWEEDKKTSGYAPCPMMPLPQTIFQDSSQKCGITTFNFTLPVGFMKKRKPYAPVAW